MKQNYNTSNTTEKANTTEKTCATNASQNDTDKQNTTENHGSLRKCKKCGLTAETYGDLWRFKWNHTSKHNRENLCVKCYQKRTTENNEKRMRFKGKQIYLPTNIRTNTCEICGKTKKENGRQMSLHHDFYGENPIEGTIEECNQCHPKEKNKVAGIRIK